MIKRKEFADSEGTFFTTEEHWGMDCGGVAWIRIALDTKMLFGKCHLFLDPDVARDVAQELNDIADSVERQELEFERNKKQ